MRHSHQRCEDNYCIKAAPAIRDKFPEIVGVEVEAELKRENGGEKIVETGE